LKTIDKNRINVLLYKGFIPYNSVHCIAQTEEPIYHSKEIKRKFDLKKGDSLFVWQIVANVFGNLVYLDHIAYTSKGEGAPTEPKFDDVKLSLEVWR
jgi:hypothetical protein